MMFQIANVVLSTFRYDRKNFGCLWDRTHPSLYLTVVFATCPTLPTFTILFTYYNIWAYARMCKAMVCEFLCISLVIYVVVENGKYLEIPRKQYKIVNNIIFDATCSAIFQEVIKVKI